MNNSDIHPTKPSFLIIGAPKSGTTSLYQTLVENPEIYLSRPKELHYFDANYDTPIEEYWSKFHKGRNKIVVGEATPHYLYLEYAARRIKEHLPSAKLVVCLRNPVDRAYADWWMYWSRARDDVPFAETVRTSLKHGTTFGIGTDCEPAWKEYYESSCEGRSAKMQPGNIYISFGYYAQYLEMYRKYFDESQIKVVLTDDLKENYAGVIGDVCDFLQVDPGPVQIPATANEAMGALARPAFGLARAIRVDRVLKYLPRKLVSHAKSLTTRLAGRPTMSKELRTELLRHYAPHNSRLEDLLGRNLESWSR